MSTYTMSDVQEADRLYDQMPMRDVAEKIGISEKTLSGWKEKGLIDTEVNHRTKYSAQTIARADELFDAMPLRQVSSLMDIPRGTLAEWSSRGWINTDRKKYNAEGRDASVDPSLLVEAYFEKESVTMKEVGQEFGVSRQTVGYHVRKYRGDL